MLDLTEVSERRACRLAGSPAMPFFRHPPAPSAAAQASGSGLVSTHSQGTVLAYDGANNLAWSATGLAVTGTDCGQEQVAAGQRPRAPTTP
jgi:hypothetical protein